MLGRKLVEPVPGQSNEQNSIAAVKGTNYGAEEN